MSPLDYCCTVQLAVLRARPASPVAGDRRWFEDTGLASRAVSLALEGRDALAITEAQSLARRYGKWMP